jgi:hypothetical protein
MKATKAFELAGLKMLCKDEGGVRSLRRILGKRASGDNWRRISEKIKQLNKTATIVSCQEYIRQIKVALQQFNPYVLPETLKPKLLKPDFDPMKYH